MGRYRSSWLLHGEAKANEGDEEKGSGGAAGTERASYSSSDVSTPRNRWMDGKAEGGGQGLEDVSVPSLLGEALDSKWVLRATLPLRSQLRVLLKEVLFYSYWQNVTVFILLSLSRETTEGLWPSWKTSTAPFRLQGSL